MSLFTFNFFCPPAQSSTEQVLKRIIERIATMPTKDEIIQAVADASAEEGAEVAAKIKALEDQIVATQMTDADKEKLLASVRGIFTPA